MWSYQPISSTGTTRPFTRSSLASACCPPSCAARAATSSRSTSLWPTLGRDLVFRGVGTRQRDSVVSTLTLGCAATPPGFVCVRYATDRRQIGLVRRKPAWLRGQRFRRPGKSGVSGRQYPSACFLGAHSKSGPQIWSEGTTARTPLSVMQGSRRLTRPVVASLRPDMSGRPNRTAAVGRQHHSLPSAGHPGTNEAT